MPEQPSLLNILENIESHCEFYDFKHDDFELLFDSIKALEIMKKEFLKITPFENYGCTCIYIAKPKKEEYDTVKKVFK